jgi:hypothetical protein
MTVLGNTNRSRVHYLADDHLGQAAARIGLRLQKFGLDYLDMDDCSDVFYETKKTALGTLIPPRHHLDVENH